MNWRMAGRSRNESGNQHGDLQTRPPESKAFAQYGLIDLVVLWMNWIVAEVDLLNDIEAHAAEIADSGRLGPFG